MLQKKLHRSLLFVKDNETFIESRRDDLFLKLVDLDQIDRIINDLRVIFSRLF